MSNLCKGGLWGQFVQEEEDKLTYLGLAVKAILEHNNKEKQRIVTGLSAYWKQSNNIKWSIPALFIILFIYYYIWTSYILCIFLPYWKAKNSNWVANVMTVQYCNIKWTILPLSKRKTGQKQHNWSVFMHGYEPDTNLLPKDNRTQLRWAQMELETMFQTTQKWEVLRDRWKDEMMRTLLLIQCQKANIERIYFLYGRKITKVCCSMAT